MYLIRSAATWEGVVANSTLDRGTKFLLLMMATRLPAYGTLSLRAKVPLVDWLKKACEMTEEQVENRLKKAHQAGFLKTSATTDRSKWTLELTFPRPAVETVINHHQDAVVLRAKTWEDALEVLDVHGDEN